MEPIPSYGIDGFRPHAPGETRSVPMQLLCAQPVFQGLDHAELKTVAELLRPTTYAPGEFVFKQGTEPDGLYLLESGEALMWTRIGDSRRDIVRFQAGAPLCLASLAENGGRVTSMEATAPSKVWVLDIASFEGLRRNGHPVAFRLLHAVASEMARSFGQVCSQFRAMIGLSFSGTSEAAHPFPAGRTVTGADLPQLKVLPFFKALSPNEQETLCAAAVWRDLPRGHRLYAEGAPAGDLHLVVRGALEAVVEGATARRRLSVRGPGRWVGHDVFFTRAAQPYAVKARETSAIWSICREAFDPLYERQHPAALRLLEQISNALSQQFNQDLGTMVREETIDGDALPLTAVEALGTPRSGDVR